MNIYYAHCMAIYNKKQEARDIETLEKLGFTVINPNAPGSEEGYKKEGMEYFFKIIDDCDALALRSNPDGSIPAGVASEVEHALGLSLPVIELPGGITRRTLTVDETREWLKESGFR